MDHAIDSYLRGVIEEGDKVSAFLAETCIAPTLKNSPYVDIISSGMHGIAVIRPPLGKYAVVHCGSGDPFFDNPRDYVISAVERLVEKAYKRGCEPVALANVIDAPTGALETIKPFASALAEQADKYHLAIVNGEFAVLGKRVTSRGNLALTLVSFESPSSLAADDDAALFDPRGHPLYMNSDGIGTKAEIYERGKRWGVALVDAAAMKLDDLAKLGAMARVVSDVVEIAAPSIKTRQQVESSIRHCASALEKEFSLTYLLNFEDATGRLASYKKGVLAVNISGSAVSTIDESRLRNLPCPAVGDYLIALRGKPTPRSNSITLKRELMVATFGNEWHQTREGALFMEFLGTPSSIFYKVFSELLTQGLASSVYHMSGGAFKGKLARPLAKHNLFVRLEHLFDPDWRELALGGFSCMPSEKAYALSPMGNEAFVTSSRPGQALEYILTHGFEGRVVGQLESARSKPGVAFSDICASNGDPLYYSGS